MSYEVWFGQNGKWFGYHSFKYKMDAQRYEERYQTVFPNLTVEIRERVHASQWMAVQSYTHRQGDQ